MKNNLRRIVLSIGVICLGVLIIAGNEFVLKGGTKDNMEVINESTTEMSSPFYNNEVYETLPAEKDIIVQESSTNNSKYSAEVYETLPAEKDIIVQESSTNNGKYSAEAYETLPDICN